MRKTFLRASVLSAAVFYAAGAAAVTDTYTSSDPGGALPDGGGGNVVMTVNTPGAGAATNITDVNVNVGITHTWAGDIDITLASVNPAVGAAVIMADCGGQKDYAGVLTIDDQAGGPPDCANVAGIIGNGAVVQSNQSATALAAFNGAVAPGVTTWTLTVADDSGICTGTLNSFSITVTSDLPLPVELSNFSVE